jgi:hypothetical protein
MATVTASYNWVSGETVTPAKLNTAAAPTVVVADNEITTAKILDANVTNAKLASGIDASKLTTGTLPIDRIADDAVTDAKLSLAANAGEIKKALNADNSPPIFACRAWVNFDGTKDTTGAASTANTNRLIRASGNVTSVLRNGAGDYTITFTTAMPDGDYAITLARDEGSAAVTRGSSGATIAQGVAPTSSAFRINCRVGSTAAVDGAVDDPPIVTATIFR